MSSKPLKIIAIILAALMILGVIPIMAFAAETRTITLDGEPGSFPEDSAYPDQNYTRKATLTADGKLPSNLPSPKYGSYKLAGWSDRKMTETKPDGSGEYWVWKLIQNGTVYHPGDVIPADVKTLYPVFEMPNKEGYKKIIFYYDWNGVNGMSGHCLKCTRDLGYKFTDGIVFNFNYSGKDPAGVLDYLEDESQYDEIQRKLEEYWANTPIQGKKGFGMFYFDGWYTAPVGGEKVARGTVLKNGQSLYAHWHKAEKKDKPAEETPDVPQVDASTGAGIETSDTFGAPAAESKFSDKEAVTETGVIKDVVTAAETEGKSDGAAPPAEEEKEDSTKAPATVETGAATTGASGANAPAGTAAPARDTVYNNAAGDEGTVADGGEPVAAGTAVAANPAGAGETAAVEKTVARETKRSHIPPVAAAAGAVVICAAGAAAFVFRKRTAAKRDGK